jgi:hypothetical protein
MTGALQQAGRDRDPAETRADDGDAPALHGARWSLPEPTRVLLIPSITL